MGSRMPAERFMSASVRDLYCNVGNIASEHVPMTRANIRVTILPITVNRPMHRPKSITHVSP